MSILVVDDEPESRRLLTAILSSEGYAVRAADGGELALASIAVKRPNLILLDIRMPDMDGLEVCRRIKAQPETRDIPLMFLSASAEPSERLEGLRLGAVDYVTKPFQREELLARVRTHLELGRLRVHLEQQVEQRTVELQSLLTEKSLLLKEVQHRVKNNLQIISSLASLQARQVGDESARQALLTMRDRVKSMALIHEGLCFSGTLAEIDFARYINDLAPRLIQSYASAPDAIRLHADIDAVLRLDEAAPCGLIVNELLSNALKYAFPDGRHGDIWITFRHANDGFCLEIRDNGIGIPREFSVENSRSLGFQIVADLAAQLHGEFSWRNEGGAACRVRFHRRGATAPKIDPEHVCVPTVDKELA